MSRTQDTAELVLELKDEMSKRLDNVKGKTKSSTKAMGVSVNKLAGAFVALGGVMALKSAFEGIKTINEYKDSILNLSNATGISVETLSKFDYIAKINKTSSDAMQASIKKLAMTIGQAEQGSTNAVRTFDKLNVNYKDQQGNLRDLESIYFDVIGSLQNTENKTERLTQAQLVFGRQASELGSVLNSTKGELEALGQEAEDLGVTFDRDGAEKAAKFNDDLLRMQSAFKGVAFEIVENVTPSFVSLFNSAMPMIKKLSEGVSDLMIGLQYTDTKSGNELLKKHQDRREAILKERDAIYESYAKIEMGVYDGDSNAIQHAKDYQTMLDRLKKEFIALNGESRVFNIRSGGAMKDVQEHLAKVIPKATEAIKNQKEAIKEAKEEFENFSGQSGEMPFYQTQGFQTQKDDSERNDILNEVERVKRRNQELAELNQQRGMTEIERLQYQYEQERDLAEKHGQDITEIKEYYSDQITDIQEENAKRQIRADKEATQQYLDNSQQILASIQQLTGANTTLSKALQVAQIGLGLVASGGNPVAGVSALASLAGVIGLSDGRGPSGNGSQDTIPALIRPDEVVLNPKQASNILWGLANNRSPESTSSPVNVTISGNFGVDENKLALMVVNAIDRANTNHQPRRL